MQDLMKYLSSGILKKKYTAAKRTKHIIAETCENVFLFLKDSVIMVRSD